MSSATPLLPDFSGCPQLRSSTKPGRLARGILLGLEFLIAADIVHTVVVDLNFATVGVLAAIVLIRTFLSMTLELEATGRWPWQAHASP